jgi:acetyl esterase/lipase
MWLMKPLVPRPRSASSQRIKKFLAAAAVAAVLLLGLRAGPIAAAEARVLRNVTYAQLGDLSLALDLHLPAEPSRPPLLVWVHGGAWRSGSRESPPIAPLVERGFAVASVDYRLTPVAPFPAQVHDIKAAIRFLRAKQTELGIDASRIAIAGDSAGGHLAALVGVSAGVAELEGDVGEHRDQSSAVQAIVSFYGPTNLTTILDQSTPHGLGVRVPALQLLLEGQPEDKPELAKLASPVTHVDAGDPPLLMFHGDQDPQVPINQSHELMGRYEKLDLPARLEVVYGGGHGGEAFYRDGRMNLVERFLNRTMVGAR